MIGETAIAVGNPFGLSNTVTTGIVSALHRTVKGEGRTYTDFIQTDAAINPGNSGGALCNVLGELIGINTAIVGGANTIGFAIPVERVRADRRRPPPLRRGQAGLDRRARDDRHGRPGPPERPRPRDAGPLRLPLLARRGRGPRAGGRRRLAERQARRVPRGLRHAPLRRRPGRLRSTLRGPARRAHPHRVHEGRARPGGPRPRGPPARDRRLGGAGARRARPHRRSRASPRPTARAWSGATPSSP